MLVISVVVMISAVYVRWFVVVPMLSQLF
jgi:hypothetical protein